MRYWLSLAFCRDHLNTDSWSKVSLDQFSQAIKCTRRNAQLLIKRLVADERIEWKAGVGRGNLPSAKLKRELDDLLRDQARQLFIEGKIDSALALIKIQERENFLSQSLSHYQPKQNTRDIVQIPFYRGTHSLDPVQINRRTEAHIASYLYARLMNIDPDTHTLQGDLAHSWQQHGNQLTVTLRKGLKFHDGSPILAEDIKAHFQRLLTMGKSNRVLFQYIDDVIINGPLSLSFVSHSAKALLPRLLAHGAMGISKLIEGKLVGSGPFALQQQTNWRTLLIVSPHYHGYRPWIDGVEIWNVGDNAKTLELNCDVVHGRHLKDKQREAFSTKNNWEEGCSYALFNPNRHQWMTKRKHRQWLQSLTLNMGSPSGEECEIVARASGMLSSPSPVTKPDLSKPLSALTELESPTHPLEIITYQLGTHIAIAQLIASSLKTLGVPCHLRVFEFPDFNKPETLEQADIIVSGEVFGDEYDMSWIDWLKCNYSLDCCLTPSNKHWLEDRLRAAIAETDISKQLKSFDRIEKQLINKGVYQPLFHTQQDLNVSDKISAPEQLANGWIDFNQITM